MKAIVIRPVSEKVAQAVVVEDLEETPAGTPEYGQTVTIESDGRKWVPSAEQLPETRNDMRVFRELEAMHYRQEDFP